MWASLAFETVPGPLQAPLCFSASCDRNRGFTLMRGRWMLTEFVYV